MVTNIAVPTEAELPSLLAAFYSRVRADQVLGPVFESAVENWPAYLGRLADFWSSVMLATGRYKGQPVAAHLAHADRITPADVTPAFHPAATRDRPVLSRMSAGEATGGVNPARCCSSSAANAAGVA